LPEVEWVRDYQGLCDGARALSEFHKMANDAGVVEKAILDRCGWNALSMPVRAAIGSVVLHSLLGFYVGCLREATKSGEEPKGLQELVEAADELVGRGQGGWRRRVWRDFLRLVRTVIGR